MPVATTFSPYFKIANKEYFKEKSDACLSTFLTAVGNVGRARLTGVSPFSSEAFPVPGSGRSQARTAQVRDSTWRLRVAAVSGPRVTREPLAGLAKDRVPAAAAPGETQGSERLLLWGSRWRPSAPRGWSPGLGTDPATRPARPCPALPALQLRLERRAAGGSSGCQPRPLHSVQRQPQRSRAVARVSRFFRLFSPVIWWCLRWAQPFPHLPAPTPFMAPPGPHLRWHSSSQGPGLPHCWYVSLSGSFQSCHVPGAPRALCEGGGVGWDGPVGDGGSAPQWGWGHGAAVPGGFCSTWRENISNPFCNGLRWCVVI